MVGMVARLAKKKVYRKPSVVLDECYLGRHPLAVVSDMRAWFSVTGAKWVCVPPSINNIKD